MSLNVKKCSITSIRHKHTYPYKIRDYVLKRVTQQRDLGILVTSDLGCSVACQKAAKQAIAQTGLLRPALGCFHPRLFPRLFATYIRPHLEYTVQIWSPWLLKDQRMLEVPLRRAAKIIHGLRNQTYTVRLKSMGFYSSYHRRIRGDLILTYKILKKTDHPCRGVLYLSPNTTLCSNSLKLAHQQSRLDCGCYSFALRVCSIWNTLPIETVQAPSLVVFKQRLDQSLLGMHVLPP